MSSKNLCLLGLLALACLFVDSYSGERALPEKGPDGGPREAARRRSGCPRNAAHRARRRADGAIWCLQCDEAFYPRAAEWESALRAVAA